MVDQRSTTILPLLPGAEEGKEPKEKNYFFQRVAEIRPITRTDYLGRTGARAGAPGLRLGAAQGLKEAVLTMLPFGNSVAAN